MFLKCGKTVSYYYNFCYVLAYITLPLSDYTIKLVNIFISNPDNTPCSFTTLFNYYCVHTYLTLYIKCTTMLITCLVIVFL